MILVFDKDNGTPLAVLDGRLITEMRTAAGSAAAARQLAHAEPNVVTIMGNGVQARAHAEALAQVRNFNELQLWARDDAARDQAGNIRGSGCEIFAEIGEIYAGTKTVPEGATIIYDSVGVAIMDVAAAKLAYDLAT